jgi:hypothetical protein
LGLATEEPKKAKAKKNVKQSRFRLILWLKNIYYMSNVCLDGPNGGVWENGVFQRMIQPIKALKNCLFAWEHRQSRNR